MTCVLALETATAACSAAIWLDGAVFEEYRIVPRRHNDEILGMVDRVTAAAGVTQRQLDGVAVGVGPGSFTGLRIGVGVAQGIAFAMDIPTMAISTLRAMAARAYREYQLRHVLAVLGARRDEVYWAAYEDTVALTPERASRSVDVVLPAPGEWSACGPGCELGAFSQSVRERLVSVKADLFPTAWDVATLGASALADGETRAPHEIEPVYLSGRAGWKMLSRQPRSDG